VLNWFSRIPNWAALSLVMNGLLFTTVLAISHQRSAASSVLASSGGLYTDAQLKDPLVIDAAIADNILDLPHPSGGRKLSYEQWREILAEDARMMAAKNPRHLSVLLGDSLSLWFPGELMPGNRVWINQSISGEKTKGLLERLDFLEDNDVEAVFLMIGINDLIWGQSDEEILANYREIVRRLKSEHPDTQIVVQSILPHGGEASTWESRDKLAALPSERIQRMNDSLKQIAGDNQAFYLDLYPIFVTGDGTLRPDLTTDGLHLNRQGYLVWRSAIALYAQLELQ